MLIDSIEYNRTDINNRLCYIVPVGGWPVIPHVFNLRKNMIESNIPKICACGSTNNLDAHHIKRIKYLRNKNGHTYQDPQDDHSASNGQWLCRKCHNNIHHNK